LKIQLPKIFEVILNVNDPYEIVNITNGKIESMNSKLRGFTKITFGFKILKKLKITIFIALSKLNLTLA